MRPVPTLCLILALLFAVAHSAQAQQRKHRKDSTTVTIHLDNRLNHNASVDSVLVIFDRYSLNGAGIIKTVYHPENNTIIIPGVPHGKYYIDVFCMGIYDDSFSEVTFVYDKRKNHNSFHFRLKRAEEFDPSAVYIPAEKIDFRNLTVTRPKMVR